MGWVWWPSSIDGDVVFAVSMAKRSAAPLLDRVTPKLLGLEANFSRSFFSVFC